VTAPYPEAVTVSCVFPLPCLTRSFISLTSQYSSGRGGVGNIRRTSASRDARPDSGPDDFSSPRGREPRPVLPTDASGTHAFSTGRGGAGNMRSPSRDARTGAGSAVSAVEDQLIRSHLAAEQDVVVGVIVVVLVRSYTQS